MAKSSRPAKSLRSAENSLSDAPIACHELDRDGRIVWVNAAECRLLGLTEGELLGRHVSEFVAPAEQEASRRAVARKLAEEQPLVTFERGYRRPDGSYVLLEIHETYRRDENGGVIGMRSFLMDITERRRAEEALHKVQEGLESRIQDRTQELELAIEFLRREMEEKRHAENEQRRLEAQVQQSQRLESIGVLAGGLAHEFNNLLTSIMGYGSLTRMDLAEGSRARHNIDQVLAAAKSAADLTQQMLAYSGRGRFVLAPLDLSQLVGATARLLESIVTQNVTQNAARNVTRDPARTEVTRKAAIHFSLAGELPRIEADTGQLRQVVVNLVTNASDSLGEDAGKITVSTGTMWAEGGELPSVQPGRTMPAGLYVFLEVNDTGCGMDAATINRIFDPFFTTKFTGRGLGLAAVLGIVRGHRGSVQVKSRPGEGTSIRVLFPALEEWEPAPLERSAKAPEWKAEGVVLVIDQDESIRQLARAILHAAGLTVLTAADGAQALTLFREHAGSIRAVLLDCSVPAIDEGDAGDGGEVFEHIRRENPDVKVILCSGYDEEEVTLRLHGQRPAGFLRKPFDPAQLIARLKAIW